MNNTEKKLIEKRIYQLKKERSEELRKPKHNRSYKELQTVNNVINNLTRWIHKG